MNDIIKCDKSTISGTICKDLHLIHELDTSQKRVVTIYSAEYKGEACFAIVHLPSGFTTVFDKYRRIYNAIKRKLKQGYHIVIDYDNARLPRFRLIMSDKEHANIDLRQFLYARYNKTRLRNISGSVQLREDSRRQDNILDLRGRNMYIPGESIEHRKDVSVSVVARQGNPQEKYITIRFERAVAQSADVVPYTPELFEMLSSPAYCRIEKNWTDGRTVAVVRYANGCDVRTYLARFVLIYKLHFEDYKNKRGGVKRFIRDYKKLSDKYDGMDAAHVNACSWNNCFENLILMHHTINKDMGNYIKWFSAPYSVYTAVNDSGEILIEFTSIGLMQNGRQIMRYYKCATVEDYLDWQNVFLGRELTRKLQVATYATTDGIKQALTPRGVVKSGEMNRKTAKGNEPNFWEWLEHRDKLLSLDSCTFYPWKAGADRTIHIQMPEKIVEGMPFVIPLGAGYIMVTPVKVEGGELATQPAEKDTGEDEDKTQVS